MSEELVRACKLLIILFVLLSTSYFSCPSFSIQTNLTCLSKSHYRKIVPSCVSQALLVDKERKQVLLKSRIIKLQVVYTQTGIPKLEHALQVPQLLLCHQALYVLIAQISGLVRDHTVL